MRSQAQSRRRRVSGSFRRSLLGALCLGLVALACICFALSLLAAPDANSVEAIGSAQDPEGWSGRRGLQQVKDESSTLAESGTIVASDFEKQSATLARNKAGERKQGPGRLKREAERFFSSKGDQSGPRSRGTLLAQSSSGRSNAGHSVRGLTGPEVKGQDTHRQHAGGQGDAIQPRTDADLANGQVPNKGRESVLLDPSGNRVSWVSVFRQAPYEDGQLAASGLHIVGVATTMPNGGQNCQCRNTISSLLGFGAAPHPATAMLDLSCPSSPSFFSDGATILYISLYLTSCTF